MEWPTLSQLVKELKSGKRDLTQLVQQCFDEIAKNKDFNAVIEINDKAIERAAALAGSTKKGKLYGVPFLAKDNFLTSDTRTTAASNILKGFRAPYQATVIDRLEAEGAILIGKTNLDSFGHGASTENSDFGPSKNPYDKSRVPGGSSGGSAAAVAIGVCAFALGTDTGGSNRQPASLCGVVGFKPTYGINSRYGVIAMASSTDTIGSLTRNVADAAYLLDIMAGPDGRDSTLIERDVTYRAERTDLNGKKFGVIKEQAGNGIEPGVKEQVESVIERLEKAGAKVDYISVPTDEAALATYYVIVPAEISSNLARYDGVIFGHVSEKTAKDLATFYEQTRGEGFNDENKRRIIAGTYALSSGYYDAYYKKAQTVRTKLIEQYSYALGKYDVLIGPTSPFTAFKIGEKKDPLSMYLADAMTVGASLVGIPAISVPIGKAGGLPVGLQLMAPQRQENRLFAAARAVEELVA